MGSFCKGPKDSGFYPFETARTKYSYHLCVPELDMTEIETNCASHELELVQLDVVGLLRSVRTAAVDNAFEMWTTIPVWLVGFQPRQQQSSCHPADCSV